MTGPSGGQDDATELTDALVQVTFTTMSVLTSVAADNELSLTQLRVLAILRDRRVRMSELAAYLGLDRSTLTGLVDRAAARGLVVREPSPHDRRAVDVTLSPAGVALADALRERVTRELLPRTSALGASERRRLSTLLAAIMTTDGR